MTKRLDFELPPNVHRERCRSCYCPIVWIKTEKGKSMPLDLNTVEEREGKRFAESHHAHCPQASSWRKKK